MSSSYNVLKIFNIYRPKRSFGQGYIFTGVCDSVHRGGVVSGPGGEGGGLQFFKGGT